MRVILQRVDSAHLSSDNMTSSIGFGLLAFVGVSQNDTVFDAHYLAKRIVNLRMFKDEFDKSNLSLLDVKGDIMIVSNFTLQADTKKGTRPDFFRAGKADMAKALYETLIKDVSAYIPNCAHGDFGNHMDIDCKLNGPFTLMIESEGRERE